MPFTTSHPALVLPLKKYFPKYFSLSGLMAGAMSPDLIYFLLNRTDVRGLSHTWDGLFIICIPAGILFTFAFHWLFKSSFISNLPYPLDKQLSDLAQKSYRPFDPKSIFILIISVMIGALSHFFIDSFTHLDGEMVQRIPFLAKETVIFGRPVLNCTILQHFSSVTGALFILIYIPKAGLINSAGENYNPVSTKSKLIFWSLGIACSALSIILNVYLRYDALVWNLPGLPSTTIGLSSWSGFFWYTAIVTIIKQKKDGPNDPPLKA